MALTRKTQRILLLLISFGLLLVGVVLLELVFGNWFSPIKLNRLHIPRNVRIVTVEDSASGSPPRKITYTRDGYGLRGNYPSPSEIDILTIGGSTTDQRNLDDGETWQAALAEQFRSEGKEVIVVNAGVNGQSTVGMTRNFTWWFPIIPGLRPKWVLVYVGINDFMLERSQDYDRLVDQSDRLDHVIAQRVKECSALFGFYKTLKGMYQAVGRVSYYTQIDWSKVQWTDQPLLRDHAALMHEPLAAYAGQLKRLSEAIQASGAKPIFVTQRWSRYRLENGHVVGVSDKWQYRGREINGVDQYHMMSLLNETTVRVAQETGTLCIDLAKELQLPQDDFVDACHTKPAGARKIAEFLHTKLKGFF